MLAAKARFAAVAGALCLAAAIPAFAQPQAAGAKTYTDPGNRFSFQYPASLSADVTDRPNQPLNILVGVADYECQIFAVNRPETADKSADTIVRSYSAPVPNDVWKRSMDGFALYGRKGAIQSATVDTTGFWPVQRAEILTDENKPAVGTLQARPGVDVWHFCTSFDGRDHTAFYNQLISTFAGPNDAALQAQAEAERAERTARQAAAEEAQKAAQAQQQAQQQGAQKQHRMQGRGLKKD